MANWPASGDTDWNTKMLAYLAIEHETDGTHKATEVTAVVTGEGIFGSWTNLDSLGATLVKDEVYQVGSDGFVLAYGSADATGETPSGTKRIGGVADRQLTMPVRKDDTWKVTVATTIYWLPIGSGTCVKQ